MEMLKFTPMFPEEVSPERLPEGTFWEKKLIPENYNSKRMAAQFIDASTTEINQAMEAASQAFTVYKNLLPAKRAGFLRAIALKISESADILIQTAHRETHLSSERLRNELARTRFQLTSYAAAMEKGHWLEASIDLAEPARNPPRPGIRKMMLPLGPVVVFGASNFPFAYSTAGGDTASALAVGCPVIVKAHPAHAETSQLVAQAIGEAVCQTEMPPGVFQHLHGAGFDVGQALVQHPLTRAVAFTGSFNGGMALYRFAAQRPVPIPVFAEMGSLNPVFILPGMLQESFKPWSEKLAASITQSMGQFCTKPGLLMVAEGPFLEPFIKELAQAIGLAKRHPLLHTGIADSFKQKRKSVEQTPGVYSIETSPAVLEDAFEKPFLAKVSATHFLQQQHLHEELFGPFSLLVICRNLVEMQAVAESLEGQLTCILLATETEVLQQATLIETLQERCGRFVLNGVPTGVEVCDSMQHGGPFPATTDARFTAVGSDSMKRFLRPIAYQNWPENLLPPPLQTANPWNIPQRVSKANL